MLGARARAAEYNAYKAATARQASREAEEQNLPPKPVPVSLSAFTKNLPPNRNKGNKAWVPLILEDNLEGDRTSCGPDDDTSTSGDYGGNAMSPPSRPATGMLLQAAERRVESVVPAVKNLQSIRGSIPHATIPNATRALSTAQDYSAPLVNPTPRRFKPHSIINHVQQSVLSSSHYVPGNPGGYSPYPIPDNSWLFNLQGLPYPGQGPLHTMATALSLDCFMVPDDISPAKQENKLAELSQVYSGPTPTFVYTQQPYPVTPGLDRHTLFPQYYPPTFAAAGPCYDHPHHKTSDEQNHPQYPELIRVNSDSMIPDDGGFRTPVLPPPALRRHASYPEPTNMMLQQRQLKERAINLASWNAGQWSTSEDEPYDRNSTMQNFVAAQYALAKTGNTVLRNPGSHQDQSKEDSPAGSSAIDEVVSCGSEQEEDDEWQENIGNQKQRLVLNDSPYLAWEPDVKQTTISDHPVSALNSTTFENLRHEFDVGSAEWFELKPVSRATRTLMNKTMRLCASVEDVDMPRTVTLASEVHRLQSLRADDQGKDLGGQKARRAIDEIAREHIAKRAFRRAADGLLANDAMEIEIESAAIRAIGYILIHIRESGDLEVKDNNDNTGYFCKYKPAPEYAVERGRLITGNMNSTSYFEEETGSFYNAPSRIARDPRFRPASKEVMKIKANDDWKPRHDMYGRRRV